MQELLSVLSIVNRVALLTVCACVVDVYLSVNLNVRCMYMYIHL